MFFFREYLFPACKIESKKARQKQIEIKKKTEKNGRKINKRQSNLDVQCGRGDRISISWTSKRGRKTGGRTKGEEQGCTTATVWQG